MATILETINNFPGIIPILRTIVLVAVLLTASNLIIMAAKNKLLKRAKTKKQISNIEIFSKILSYAVIILTLVLAIFMYSGSWTGLGVTIGLLSAALGFALQKLIMGVTGWVIIVARRPFDIGDRISIGNVKGDVINITLTHIYIHEIGGIVDGEENS